VARIRTIKPEFFTSPSVAKLDYAERLFFQALWCAADDFGVGETNLNALLGLAFPDSDEITAPILRRFCANVARHLRVTFYTVRGRHYYAIETWEEHQKIEKRPERRKYPTPDDPDAMPDQRIYDGADSAPVMPRKSGADSRGSGAGTGEQGNRGTGEQGKGNDGTTDVVPSAPRPRNRRRVAEDYMPAPAVIEAIKDETGATSEQLRYQHRKFIDHWLKTGKPMADWDACWRNWMRTASERGEFGAASPGTKPSKLRALADLAAEVREMEATNGKAIQA